MKSSLYLYALRAARPRQLRARALRPLARRRFGGDPSRLLELAGIPAAEALWRSLAFEPSAPVDPGTRLGRFQAQYGEDVLGAARAGDVAGARELVERWIAANPPRDDDAWHPYTTSTRVGSWVAAVTLEPSLASPRVAESLWHQLRRVELNIEDELLGNHVIRNARALVLGGMALGERRFLRRGLELLRRELPEQILPDGGHYERSPVYHLIVLRDLLEVEAATREAWLHEPIERMRGFASALQRPDGMPALFNDGGLDLAPRLGLPEPPTGLAVFPDTGYAVLRSGPLWLAFDCGPPAPPFLPAHAHADALSVQLWWYGRPVLVDSGTSTYEPGAERDRMRSTRAHSTIAIDGKDQFELWRAFRAGRLPDVSLLEASDGGLEASIEWPGGIRHFRRVSWTETEVVIRDRIEGKGRHRIESRLVLAPGLPKTRIGVLGGGAEAVRERGWVSERFGERSATDVVVVEHESELPIELGWQVTGN